ncbi:Os02g0152950 [Oryza sativa Japonica Group]|uniref:Os02g0152950 protein n=1 Tax=Oryza sativa subsp. japonica TaxID=39947 RepID=A0A0P0VEZ0_ORYSJ|nr:hypothetical protein EE612_008919 [Oryza sativa]BAS77024.1 Os02g0152950 [Oryza sativa Japonica Group]
MLLVALHLVWNLHRGVQYRSSILHNSVCQRNMQINLFFELPLKFLLPARAATCTSSSCSSGSLLSSHHHRSYHPPCCSSPAAARGRRPPPTDAPTDATPAPTRPISGRRPPSGSDRL